MANRKGKIMARVSQEERELLDRIAEIERVDRSEALRFVLRAEGRRRGLWPPEQSDDPRAGAGGVA